MAQEAQKAQEVAQKHYKEWDKDRHERHKQQYKTRHKERRKWHKEQYKE